MGAAHIWHGAAGCRGRGSGADDSRGPGSIIRGRATACPDKGCQWAVDMFVKTMGRVCLHQPGDVPVQCEPRLVAHNLLIGLPCGLIDVWLQEPTVSQVTAARPPLIGGPSTGASSQWYPCVEVRKVDAYLDAEGLGNPCHKEAHCDKAVSTSATFRTDGGVKDLGDRAGDTTAMALKSPSSGDRDGLTYCLEGGFHDLLEKVRASDGGKAPQDSATKTVVFGIAIVCIRQVARPPGIMIIELQASGAKPEGHVAAGGALFETCYHR